METVSSTRFARQFGRHNQEVQSDIIQVTSHGRPIGYYLSPRAYERLMLDEEEQQPISFRETVLKQVPQIKKLAKEHKVKRIRLFGSVARGDDTPNSDVDFLVTFQDDYDLMDDRLALATELENLLGRKVDLVLQGELHEKIAASALKDAMDL